MILRPPAPGAIISGLVYGLKIALRRGTPQDISPTTGAIQDALWFRYMLTLFNGVLVLGFSDYGGLIMLAALGLIDVLSYPVASHFVLRLMLLERFFPQFILAVTWVGNLRIIVLMTAILMAGSASVPSFSLIVFPFAIWMIWATWSAAARSIENRGWLGGGMLVLMMLVELINWFLFVSFLHPLPVDLGQSG